MKIQYKVVVDQGYEGGGEEREGDTRDRNRGYSRGIPRLGRQRRCRDGEEVIDTLAMQSSVPDLQSKV